jgi:hypothetical protein
MLVHLAIGLRIALRHLQRWEAHLCLGSLSDRPSLALALVDSVASLARTRAPTPRLFIVTIDLRGHSSVQWQRFARR